MLAIMRDTSQMYWSCSFFTISLYYRFIYFWLYYALLWHTGLFADAPGFPLVLVSRGLLIAGASHCSGFSCGSSRAQKGANFSSCGSRALEHGFSSCGTWAWLPHGTWDLPGPETKPVSPELTDS